MKQLHDKYLLNTSRADDTLRSGRRSRCTALVRSNKYLSWLLVRMRSCIRVCRRSPSFISTARLSRSASLSAWLNPITSKTQQNYLPITLPVGRCTISYVRWGVNTTHVTQFVSIGNSRVLEVRQSLNKMNLIVTFKIGIWQETRFMKMLETRH